MDFDASRRKPSCCADQDGVIAGARIAANHLLPAGAQDKRGGDAGAGQPDDEIRTRRERRPVVLARSWRTQPRMLSWYTTNPIAPQAAATIQKRRMIFVSDHAWSSKWWWIGAIRKTRLRNV